DLAPGVDVHAGVHVVHPGAAGAAGGVGDIALVGDGRVGRVAHVDLVPAGQVPVAGGVADGMAGHDGVVDLGRLHEPGVDVPGDGRVVRLLGGDDARVGVHRPVERGEGGAGGDIGVVHADDANLGPIANLGEQPHRIARHGVVHHGRAEAEGAGDILLIV